MSNYRIRQTQLTALPDGEPIFSERATKIEIVDEAGGEYLRITQQTDRCLDPGLQSICIEGKEWDTIKRAIETLLDEIKTNEERNNSTKTKTK